MLSKFPVLPIRKFHFAKRCRQKLRFFWFSTSIRTLSYGAPFSHIWIWSTTYHYMYLLELLTSFFTSWSFGVGNVWIQNVLYPLNLTLNPSYTSSFALLFGNVSSKEQRVRYPIFTRARFKVQQPLTTKVGKNCRVS